MSQITLRQLPVQLENQLRQLSKQNRTSLNKTITTLLMYSLGISSDIEKKRDLSDLAGTWDEDEYSKFTENTEFFDNIDREIWE